MNVSCSINPKSPAYVSSWILELWRSISLFVWCSWVQMFSWSFLTPAAQLSSRFYLRSMRISGFIDRATRTPKPDNHLTVCWRPANPERAKERETWRSNFTLWATNQAEVLIPETRDLMIRLNRHQGNKPTDIHDAAPFRSFFLIWDLQELIVSPLLVATSIASSRLFQKRFHYNKTCPFNILHRNCIYCSVHLNEWWWKHDKHVQCGSPKGIITIHGILKDPKPVWGRLQLFFKALKWSSTLFFRFSVACKTSSLQSKFPH